MLTVLPGNRGRAVLAARDYAEFAALPTASGLVLTPYADDLSVTVANARVTITRPGGLSLTPPHMPVAQSPAALAHAGERPELSGFRRLGPADRRLLPGHRTAPDPVGGAAQAAPRPIRRG